MDNRNLQELTDFEANRNHDKKDLDTEKSNIIISDKLNIDRAQLQTYSELKQKQVDSKNLNYY